MASSILFPYTVFESSIVQSQKYLDETVPSFLNSLESAPTAAFYHNALDSFISSLSFLITPGLESQMKEIVAVHTLQYSSRIEPILIQCLEEQGGKSDLIQKFYYLGWEPLIDRALKSILSSRIHSEIKLRLNIFLYNLHSLENWCEDVRKEIVAWNYKAANFVEFLENEMHLQLGLSLINQMLDIIIDFPETKPGLSDLAACLSKHLDLKSTLESRVKAQLQQRIVHCSKSTDGILLVYINLTKVMKILFPTMEILESISDPIKKELRKRNDTFKCIIKTIAEDGELYALLDIKQKSVKEQDEFSSDEDELGAFEWQPIPRSALRNVISALNKRSDIVSMLINIYGSQEQFMEEYRIHLSKKLVSNTEFEVVTEIKDLEMLKKRFGEANLHKCEVMIQDVLSSKRINSFIHEGSIKESFFSLKNLDFLIISSYFWPIDEQDYKFNLPPKLASCFKEYSDKYNIVKASRKLKFHEQLGSVTLTLDFENGSKTWTGVSPLHAAIISLFDEESMPRSSEELSTALGISQHQLRKEIAFWETRGVVIRTKQNDEFFYQSSKTLP